MHVETYDRVVTGVGIALILSGIFALGFFGGRALFVLAPPPVTVGTAAPSAAIVRIESNEGGVLRGKVSGVETRFVVGNETFATEADGGFVVNTK